MSDHAITDIRDAILHGAPAAELARLPLPATYRGAVVRRADADAAQDVPVAERDPEANLRLMEVPLPELAPDEVVVAVMASSINHNTVWSSLFSPMPSFQFLDRYGRTGPWAARHALDHHVLGTDASGVVLRVGSAVWSAKPGDRVVVHGNHVEGEDPHLQEDSIVAGSHRAWGFETNFGGLADLTVVKASQLLPKPAHLTWEEAAVNTLCNSTAYRMLISPHGARIKVGDVVLIWGATGGIGIYGVQLTLAAGAIPVGVVSSERRARLLRAMGVEHVIDRRAYRFLDDRGLTDPSEADRFAGDVTGLTGEAPHVVFEHPGRETFAASVAACRRGGSVTTCAATSGHLIEFDHRLLQADLKQVIGTHFANTNECAEANRLVARGIVHPCHGSTVPLTDIAAAVSRVHHNRHDGKVAVRCLAPHDGTGVDDEFARARIGVDRILGFANAVADLDAVEPLTVPG